MSLAELHPMTVPLVIIAGPLLALALVVWWTWQINRDRGGLG